MNYSVIIPSDRVAYFNSMGIQVMSTKILSGGWVEAKLLIVDDLDLWKVFEAGVNCGIDAAFNTTKKTA